MFGQGFASMSAPSKELERVVISNAFHHGGHPVLRRHTQAVAIEGPDAADNIKPAKSKSTEPTDGLAGLRMSIGFAIRDLADTGDRRRVVEGKWEEVGDKT